VVINRRRLRVIILTERFAYGAGIVWTDWHLLREL
jgi:hypothetical protein